MSDKKTALLFALAALLAMAAASNAQLSCSSNTECDDQNPVTLDYCQRAGQENSGCSNVSCTPACNMDSDCSDGDDATLDVCAGAGRCTAVCSHLALCGNGTSDPGETQCNCPQDAGNCAGEAQGVCREFACIGDSCQQTIALGCCANNICEYRENYSTCPADCKAKNLQITIEGVGDQDYFVRGEEVSVRAIITADQVEITDAQVELEGFFGVLNLYNDGRHGDGAPFDNVYANTILIPENIEADVYPVTVNTLFENNRGIKTFSLTVEPKLEVRMDVSSENVVLGDAITVSGIVSKKTTGIKSAVEITVYSNSIPVAKEEVQSNDLGEFSYSYRTSFLDSEGTWRIEAFTKDELENTGFVASTVNVSSSDITAFLNVRLAKEIKENYSRGENIPVSISVTDKDSAMVKNAQVSVLIPGFVPLALEEKDGFYEGTLEIGTGFALGKQELKINAQKIDQNNFFAGSTTLEFTVLPTQIIAEITSPAVKSVQAGEELEFTLSAQYPGQKPVVLEFIDANINGKTLRLNAVQKGIYSARYVVTPEDSPGLLFEVVVDDSLGNTASKELLIEVSGLSVFFYVRNFGLQIGGAVAILLAMVLLFFIIASKKARLSNLKKEEKKIIEELKGLQVQYFKEGTLDRKNYERLMEKYESQLEDTRKSIAQIMAEKK